MHRKAFISANAVSRSMIVCVFHFCRERPKCFSGILEFLRGNNVWWLCKIMRNLSPMKLLAEKRGNNRR